MLPHSFRGRAPVRLRAVLDDVEARSRAIAMISSISQGMPAMCAQTIAPVRSVSLARMRLAHVHTLR